MEWKRERRTKVSHDIKTMKKKERIIIIYTASPIAGVFVINCMCVPRKWYIEDTN